MATTLRGKKTIYARQCDTLDPFAWLGKCSRMGGVESPKGDINITYCQGDITGEYEEDQTYRSAPGATTSTLMIKESIRNQLYDALQLCEWDYDIRTMNCERRDDPHGWDMIKRLCCAEVTAVSTDDESSYSYDDEGETVVSAPLSTRKQPVIIYKNIRGQRVEEVDMTLYYISRISVCHPYKCPDECGAAEDCTLIGTAIADTPSNPPAYAVSEDGGQNWTVNTIGVFTTATGLSDIACLGNLIVAIASGEPGYAYSWDFGATWTLVDDTDVPAFATYAPLVVGIYNMNKIIIGGEWGYTWMSDDGGISVDSVDEGVVTGSSIQRIRFFDSETVYIVGDNNTMKVSVNGGTTWAAITLPVGEAGSDVYALLPVTDLVVLIGYDSGGLYNTIDGGVNWNQDASIPANYPIRGLDMCGCGIVFAAGQTDGDVGIVYRNVDYGAPSRWLEVDIDDPGVGYQDVGCCNQNHAVAVGNPSGVYGAGLITLMQ